VLSDRAGRELSADTRYAMLSEACQDLVTGAQLASADSKYSAAMHLIDGRLAKGQHCPPR